MPDAQGKVRYAVVAGGWISQGAFMPGVGQTDNSVMTALVTGDPVKGRDLAAHYHLKSYHYDDYATLLASGAIDAVYIATPNFRHREFAVPALEAGIHVLLEKPMATSEEDCLAINAAAERGNALLMIAYRLHCEPATVELVGKLRAGAIGEPRLFTSSFSQLTKTSNHRAQHGYWAGPVVDMGPYPLNAVRNLFGGEPLEVSAMGVNTPGRDINTYDTVSVTLRFSDTSNRALPAYQKALGLSVKQSNICTEITLATDAERTAVCCLASANAEYWPLWRDNYLFYRDIAEMLDNVLEMFIRRAPKSIERARFSASRERAIGIGLLGFHALLQQKGIAFESAMASVINRQIFERMKRYTDQASRELAEERGPCPDAAASDVMERFSHKLAIAPNASTSIIMGNTSASIELFRANAYKQDTLSGSYVVKNRYLDEILKQRLGDGTPLYNSVWSSIVASGGSCQHVIYLTDVEKDVFKTFSEVDQMWVIQHAADRQPYIDQAQSVNLAFRADAPIEFLHAVHYAAWERGLKTLYYCRSEKLYLGEAENNHRGDITYNIPTTFGEPDCLACQ